MCGMKSTLLVNTLYFKIDNAFIHRSRTVKQWNNKNEIKSIEWMPQSTDLNIIENVWSVLKNELGKIDDLPFLVENFEKRVLDIWSTISMSYVQSSVKSMPKICSMVSEGKGGPIKY